MRKGRSNHTESADKSNDLPKADILRGRKNFERLFKGSATVFSEDHISLRFHTFTDQEETCKMGFIAGKRLGKATTRNYLKRILREAYRIQRHELMAVLAKASAGLHGVLIAKTPDLNFETAEKEVGTLLHRLTSHVCHTYNL